MKISTVFFLKKYQISQINFLSDILSRAVPFIFVTMSIHMIFPSCTIINRNYKMASRRVQAIAEDLKNIEFETSEDVEITPTFDGMGLREDLLRGIYAYGRIIVQFT